mgnify:CR=1 FL=1
MALVTGASSGPGAHFAKGLASAGAKLVLAARRASALAATAGEISAAGGSVDTITLDVTDAQSVHALSLIHISEPTRPY